VGPSLYNNFLVETGDSIVILESPAELKSCELKQNVITPGSEQAGLIESMWGQLALQPVLLANCTLSGSAAEVELYNADLKESQVFFSDSDLVVGEKDEFRTRSPLPDASIWSTQNNNFLPRTRSSAISNR
jgi:hypothetical protein